jgi:CBS domain-containing protein
MHAGLITCSQETRLGEAASLMARHGVHALIVADDAGLPLGVLADTDLLAAEWLSIDEQSLATMQSITAGELMTTPVASIDVDASVEKAAAGMRGEHVARLIVEEDGRAVGVIATSDFVRNLARKSSERDSVAQVMSWGIVTCMEQTPLRAAARAMSERHSRSIAVVDGRGACLGVLSGFDLLAAYRTNGLDGTVSNFMHPPITVSPDASLREAADLMLKHEIHRLVVVDPRNANQVPIGVISTSDVVAEMAAPDSIWQSGPV